MGVGYPIDLVVCVALGVDMFDCISEGTKITLFDGSYKNIEDIKKNDKVITINTSSNKSEAQLVNGTINKGKRNCFEMILLDGTSLTCTNDHKILVYENNQLIWKKSNEIKHGDLVVKSDTPLIREKDFYKNDNRNFLTQNMLDEFGNNINSFPCKLPITENDIDKCIVIARILGNVLTDGYLSKAKNAIIGAVVVSHLKDVNEVLHDLEILGFKNVRFEKCDSYMEKTDTSMCTYKIHLPSPLPYAINLLGVPIGKKTNKSPEIPDWILDAPKHFTYEFLGSVLGGDGLSISIEQSSINKGIGVVKCSEFKYFSKLKLFFKKLTALFQIIGFNEETKVYSRIYLKTDKKNIHLGSDKGNPFEMNETEIRKVYEIQENHSIMVETKLYLNNNDISKFEKEMKYIYCHYKTKEFREKISFLNLKNYLLKKKNEIHQEIISLYEKGKFSQIECIEKIKDKYENCEDFLNMIPNDPKSVFRVNSHDQTVGSILLFPYYWKGKKNLQPSQKKSKIWSELIDMNSEDFIVVPFAERKNVGEKLVFDLSIDNNHNFIASSIIVHNCVYPSRTARFGTALVPEGTMKLKSNQFQQDFEPIDNSIDTFINKHYTRSFMNTIVTREEVACNLMTMNNISYQMNLMKNIRQAIKDGKFPEFVQDFFEKQFPKKDYPQWSVDALDSVGIKLK